MEDTPPQTFESAGSRLSLKSRLLIAALLIVSISVIVLVKSSSARVALGGIEIANLLALGREKEVSAKLDALAAEVSHQPENFKVDWSFRGTAHFIAQSEKLTRHREWLGKLFAALQGADRDKILVALREQAKIPT